MDIPEDRRRSSGENTWDLSLSPPPSHPNAQLSHSTSSPNLAVDNLKPFDNNSSHPGEETGDGWRRGDVGVGNGDGGTSAGKRQVGGSGGGGSGSGGSGRSRLVRWAAALAAGTGAGTNTDAAIGSFKGRPSQGHHRNHGNGGGRSNPAFASSASGGGAGGDGGGNGDGSDEVHITDLPATEGPTTAEGLFVTPVSPLRNRFRPSASRRGSKGWSSFTSIPGRGGVGGVGGAGGGRGVLANMFTGRLAMQVVRHVKMAAALGALAIAGLGALLVGCCLYLTVRPWGRATYRRFLCSQLAAPLVDSAALLLPRTRVRVTGDSDMLDGLCPCVIVSNTLPGHTLLGLDWWAILMVARAVGAHGHTKVLVSERLIRTPMLGWILRMLEFPGLGDCYQTDRDRVKQCLASFAKDSLSAGPSGVPYLFLHFPEGDTVNRETLASSLEFAKREGRPELGHVLLPHTTALSGCLDGLRSAKPVIYDVTLAAAGYSGEVPCGRPPSDWQILRALVTGRAWDAGVATPCTEPSCACRRAGAAAPSLHNRSGSLTLLGSTSTSAVTGGGSGDVPSVDTCDDPTCLCRSGAVAAGAQPIAFNDQPGGEIGGAVRGIARSLSASGVSRNPSGREWTEGAGNGLRGDDVGRGVGRWGRGCQDIHVRIKRYSLEEVVGKSNWLDDRWAEKERLLSYFSRHQSFQSDGRGFPARRTLDTRGSQFEGSAMSFVRLAAVVVFVPLVFLASIPIIIMMGVAAMAYRVASAVVRTVSRCVLPRSIARRFWRTRGCDDDDEEDDELGQGLSGAQSTLTPWWGGPSTPLNTPAPGGALGTMAYVTGGAPSSSHGGASLQHDYLS